MINNLRSDNNVRLHPSSDACKITKSLDNQDKQTSPSKMAKGTVEALEKRIQELECEQMVAQLKARSKASSIKASTADSITLVQQGSDTTSIGKEIKSGFDIKNQAKIVNIVFWPHCFSQPDPSSNPVLTGQALLGSVYVRLF